MDEKNVTPLTTDEILERAYHREVEAQETEEYEDDSDGMTADEAEAYAQGFVPFYGNS